MRPPLATKKRCMVGSCVKNWHVPAALAVSAAALVVAAGPQAAAEAGVPHDRNVTIRTFADKCLDVSGGSTADRTQIIQYRCTGAANQQFRIRDVGGGRVEIRTFANKCLDVRGASIEDRADIIQFGCGAATSFNQHFTLREIPGGARNDFYIGTFADKCLDVRGANPEDRATIIQFGCGAATSFNQRFSIG